MSQIISRARKKYNIPSRGSKCLTLYHEVVLGLPYGELKLLNIEFCLPMCDVSGIIDDQADCNDEVDAADGVQVWPLTQFSASIGFCDQPPLKGLRSQSSSRVVDKGFSKGTIKRTLSSRLAVSDLPPRQPMFLLQKANTQKN